MSSLVYTILLPCRSGLDGLSRAVATSNTTCSNGLVGLENGDGTVCCVSGCEPCGGSKCAGTPGLSSDDCCAGTIEANGQLCSDTNAAPCVLDTARELFRAFLLLRYICRGAYVCVLFTCESNLLFREMQSTKITGPSFVARPQSNTRCAWLRGRKFPPKTSSAT